MDGVVRYVSRVQPEDAQPRAVIHRGVLVPPGRHLHGVEPDALAENRPAVAARRMARPTPHENQWRCVADGMTDAGSHRPHGERATCQGLGASALAPRP
jgi:hypothetical protein